MLHIPIVHAHDISKQIPQEKKFSTQFFTLGFYYKHGKLWASWWGRTAYFFSGNGVFNPPPPKKKMKRKKKNKEQAWLVSSHFVTLSESKLENININVIKQLVYTSAVRSSRYEALGKFGEHSRSSLKQLLCIFVLSKTSCVLHISMNIH